MAQAGQMHTNGSSSDASIERAQIARAALDLSLRLGTKLTIDELAANTVYSRAQIIRHFPTETHIVEAAAEQWFAVEMEIINEVMASDLPIRDKLYEFFARRFEKRRNEYLQDPEGFAILCAFGTSEFETIRGFIELADHHLSELIGEAQSEGYLAGYSIDEALSLVNQMVMPYVYTELLLLVEPKLSTRKLRIIVDTILSGLKKTSEGSPGITDGGPMLKLKVDNS